MFNRFFLITAVILFTATTLFSQDQATATETTNTPIPVERNATHYVGVQVNQLMRQILNLSNNNTPINNPYVLMYAVNSKTTGVGASFGLGYNLSETTNNEQNLKRETTVNDLFLRGGIEKKTTIAKNLLVSYGFDLLYSKQKDNTKATVQQTSFKSITETDHKTKGWGMGPRFTLQYALSSKLLIGTEASYYFKSAKTNSTFKTSETQSSGGQSSSNTNKEETDDKTKRVEFTAPIVLLLTLKF